MNFHPTLKKMKTLSISIIENQNRSTDKIQLKAITKSYGKVTATEII